MSFSIRPFRRFQLQSVPHTSLGNLTPVEFVGQRQSQKMLLVGYALLRAAYVLFASRYTYLKFGIFVFPLNRPVLYI